MKSILIIFTKSLLLFILLFLCYNLFFNSFKELEFIKKILLPSLIVTVILLIIHVIFSKIAGVKSNYSTFQYKNIDSNISLDELSNKIEEKSNWNLVSKNNYSLVYRSNFNSLKSFGETITINHMQKQIKISSKPILSTTIFDFGKNYQNIKFVNSLI